MNRSILVISYYFPPLGMAGVQRPLGLAKYLHRLGWKVYVLTVKPVSYWETDFTLLEDFPKEIPIFRAGSLDPARISYFFGRKKRGAPGSQTAALGPEERDGTELGIPNKFSCRGAQAPFRSIFPTH